MGRQNTLFFGLGDVSSWAGNVCFILFSDLNTQFQSCLMLLGLLSFARHHSETVDIVSSAFLAYQWYKPLLCRESHIPSRLTMT